MELTYIKVYRDLSATISLLSDAEAGRLFKAVMDYANGRAVDLPGQERLVFAMLKAQIDRDAEDYRKMTDRQRENGSKGGRPKKPDGFSENPKNPVVFKKTQKSQDKDKEKDKDKDKDKDEDISFCTEQATPASVPPLSLNDGSDYIITQKQLSEWQELYPAVDVEQQLRQMKGWLDANPKKRKTKSGIARFITAWLAREQDRGGTRGYAAPPAAQKSETQRVHDELADWLEEMKSNGYT